MLKNDEIKIRMPRAIKLALKAVAGSRFTSESEVAREALLAYLSARGLTPAALRESETAQIAEKPPVYISDLALAPKLPGDIADSVLKDALSYVKRTRKSKKPATP